MPSPRPSPGGRGSGDPPVHDLHDALRPPRGDFGVGREDECHTALPPHLVEEREDFRAVTGVEVSGRFVGEEKLRARDERARDRGALHFAAGELVRVSGAPVSEVDARKEVRGPFPGVGSPVEKARQLDVLPHGQVGQEVEELEDDADVPPPVERALPVGQGGDVAAADPDRSGRGRVDSRDEVEERRLAASRGSDDREELAGGNGQVDAVEGEDRLRPRVGFRDPLADDRGRRRRRRARIRRGHAGEDIGYLSRLLSPFQRIWRQRALVVALARRELQARYRGGALGFLWSFLNPLLLLLVYATIFRVVFTPRADVRPYALFLFAGVLCWGFVSAALADAAETFRANGPLLRKTTVAPEVFPAVAVAARFAHLGLALPVLAGAVAVAAVLGAVRADSAVAQFPVVLLLLAAMTAGAALLVSALSVHFGDVRDLLGNLLTLAFFLTPVLYPLDAVPGRLRLLLWANPFTPFFAAIHDSVFYFRAIGAGTWAGMIFWTVFSLAAGGAVFERLRDSIAEEA